MNKRPKGIQFNRGYESKMEIFKVNFELVHFTSKKCK